MATSSHDDFREAMEREAGSQGIHLTRTRAIVGLLDPGPAETFANIFAADDRRDLLILSSDRTYQVHQGPIRSKKRWSVPHADLVNIRATRRPGPRGFVVDSLLLQSATQIIEFRFGFNDPSDRSEVKREIAAHDACEAAKGIGILAHSQHREKPGGSAMGVAAGAAATSGRREGGRRQRSRR